MFKVSLADGTKIAKLPEWLVPAPATLIQVKGSWYILVTIRHHDKTITAKKCWEPERMVNDYANKR